jgi:HEPN domain-containing protein
MTNLDEQITYLAKTAQENLDAAEVLLKTGHFDSCLFFCHLAIEKELKSIMIRHIKEMPPKSHDLEKLAILAKVNFSQDQLEDLRIITTFNIAGRYNDDKFAFYKLCTKEYTLKYFDISKKIFLWLKKEYL